MFTVYHSNDLHTLNATVAELIEREPLDNPLQQEQFIVQGSGMSQWLKMELAKSFGVAANLSFSNPVAYIWKLLAQVSEGGSDKSVFSNEVMKWKLIHILPELLEQHDFLYLKEYLGDDVDGFKLYQLVNKIVDIFDKYLAYRPDWIRQWELGITPEELEGEPLWQQALWRELIRYTNQLGQPSFHVANIGQELICQIERLIEQGKLLPELPKRVFIFVITALPPELLGLFKVLGKHIDVHYLFYNPSRYYWGEVRDQHHLDKLVKNKRRLLRAKSGKWLAKNRYVSYVKDTSVTFQQPEIEKCLSGNSLLLSMGTLARDTVSLLSEMQLAEIDAGFKDKKSDHLLSAIQSDILNMEERRNIERGGESCGKLPISRADSSLTIHACHSPMREVEVLHDNLLAMFEADKSLRPRDIIVMAPDIHTYSPAVEAVFGNVESRRHIPFSISDRSTEQENVVVQAFLNLMLLPLSRCSLTTMIEILEVPTIMRKFGFTFDGLETIKRWISESGVRWGLDQSTANEFELPEQTHNTWLFGIQRMILGYAMPQEAGLFDDIAPFDNVQGMDAELAGQLASFVDCLIDYRVKLAEPQPITSWSDVLLQLLDDFFETDLNEELVLNTIRTSLYQVSKEQKLAGFQGNISPRVMHHHLKEIFSKKLTSHRLLTGQVNFCSLTSMRSIPFKAVCLLGMNDSTYPRRSLPESFNLMKGHRRLGDRTQREDDRYLFLEAILSAQDKLYISYEGRSIHDNACKTPSILVQELLEYCQNGYCLEGEQALTASQTAKNLLGELVRYHPLVPFSPSAFVGKHSSFAVEWLPAAARTRKTTPIFADLPFSDESARFDVLDLSELQRFWRSPVQYFFNRRLNVYFDAEKQKLQDSEPFSLNGLEDYQLKQSMLSFLLEHQSVEKSNTVIFNDFVAQKKAEGQIPANSFGDVLLEELYLDVTTFLPRVKELTQTPLDDQPVALNLQVKNDEIHLHGTIKGIYGSGLVRYRPGVIKGIDILACWIDHLCISAGGHSLNSTIFGFNNKTKTVESLTFKQIDESEAVETLSELLEFYRKGLSMPLAFFPEAAKKGMEKVLSNKKEQAIKAMREQYYSRFGESADQYVSRVWSNWTDLLAEDCFALATKVMLKALDAECHE